VPALVLSTYMLCARATVVLVQLVFIQDLTNGVSKYTPQQCVHVICLAVTFRTDKHRKACVTADNFEVVGVLEY
jgi:hypothetical protein